MLSQGAVVTERIGTCHADAALQRSVGEGQCLLLADSQELQARHASRRTDLRE